MRACYAVFSIFSISAAWACPGSLSGVPSPIEVYREAFLRGEAAVDQSLRGRVLMGKSDGDFAQMSRDRDRLAVFYFGPDALERFPSLSPMEILESLGYTRTSLERLMVDRTFKLVVFRDEGMKPATWQNVARYTERHFPEAGAKVTAALPKLQSVSFGEVEVPHDLEQVHDAGRADPRFMTLSRFCGVSGSLWEVRAFLFHEFGLRDLFRGDGYVQKSDGRGDREYLGPNLRLADIPHVLIDLPLER